MTTHVLAELDPRNEEFEPYPEPEPAPGSALEPASQEVGQ